MHCLTGDLQSKAVFSCKRDGVNLGVSEFTVCETLRPLNFSAVPVKSCNDSIDQKISLWCVFGIVRDILVCLLRSLF